MKVQSRCVLLFFLLFIHLNSFELPLTVLISQNTPSLILFQAAGKYRQQGRNYIVEDGDIIFFKFNTPNAPKKKP